MDIRRRLQELKEMYEKGLITAAIYEERQRAVLSAHGGDGVSSSIAEPPSGLAVVLDPKRNLASLGRLAVIAVAVLIAIWFAYMVSGRQGKDAISQFASQTGIGKQVIPWTDRADTAARNLIERNRDNVAAAIQGITHPTGTHPALANYDVSKLPDRIVVEMTVAWKGGFLGGEYSTTVAWEIAERSHVSAKVMSDSAVVAVEAKNEQLLDDYFRDKVYPAFVADTGGG
jgi:hypothetical protein